MMRKLILAVGLLLASLGLYSQSELTGNEYKTNTCLVFENLGDENPVKAKGSFVLTFIRKDGNAYLVIKQSGGTGIATEILATQYLGAMTDDVTNNTVKNYKGVDNKVDKEVILALRYDIFNKLTRIGIYDFKGLIMFIIDNKPPIPSTNANKRNPASRVR